MTREANLCGYPNRRCAGCDNAVSRTLDECPSCGGADIGPSTCRNPVKVEGEKCRTHNPGQMAPQVKRKAAERKLESDLRSLLALYDLGEVTNPLQACLDNLAEQRAWKELCGALVAKLSPEQWRYEGRTGEEVRAELTLYERADDRYSRSLQQAARLDLDERIAWVNARATELEGQRFLAAHRAAAEWFIVEYLGLDPAVVPVAQAALGERVGQELAARNG